MSISIFQVTCNVQVNKSAKTKRNVVHFQKKPDDVLLTMFLFIYC